MKIPGAKRIRDPRIGGDTRFLRLLVVLVQDIIDLGLGLIGGFGEVFLRVGDLFLGIGVDVLCLFGCLGIDVLGFLLGLAGQDLRVFEGVLGVFLDASYTFFTLSSTFSPALPA